VQRGTSLPRTDTFHTETDLRHQVEKMTSMAKFLLPRFAIDGKNISETASLGEITRIFGSRSTTT
jgi:hypothetical protein